MTIGYSDYLQQSIGNVLSPWQNVWVGLVSNNTSTAYKADGLTDSKGKFTFTTKPPGDTYTVYTSPTGAGLPPGGNWSLFGDANYAIPVVQGENISMQSYTGQASGPYTATAPPGAVYAQGLPLSRGVDLVSGTSRAEYMPTFTKLASNPIMTLAGQSFTSMLWPWLIRVDTIFGAPGVYGENYRIYYSTDHEGATAAIGLLTATSITGTWTDRGQVYQDTAGGNQTEEPSVVWVPELATFYMYYGMVGAPGATGSKTTLLATSTDGITWTRVGIVVDIPASDTFGYPGASPAYFRPFRIGQAWYAHGTIEGTNYTRFALFRSMDGLVWRIDPRPLGYGANLLPTAPANSATRVEWDSGNVFLWHGQPWWLGLITDFSSGGGARVTYYGMAPISADFRQLLAMPTVLFSSLQAWETSPTDNRSGGSVLVDTDGLVYLAYSGSTTGFGVAVGV